MKRILIAGASGFVGSAIIERLLQNPEIEIVALSRSRKKSNHPRLVWKQADLFSLKDINEAMVGCHEAIYLVHSMLPSATLVQGEFYDLDLILADNFKRACDCQGIKHILYLGGLLPVSIKNISWHLKSRYEVEECLRAASAKLTALRAGMILGEGGSSFVMMKRLVERLPVMICPAWTYTQTQVIDLRDLVEVVNEIMIDDELKGKVWDVGYDEVISYQKLMEKTAKALGKNVKFFKANLAMPKFSWIWVSMISGAPKNLVAPLIQSLKHPMLVREGARFPKQELIKTSIDESLQYLANKEEIEVHAFNTPFPLKAPKHVRSVQRLPLPHGKNAMWVANEYFNWLPRIFSFFIKSKVEDTRCKFYFLIPSIELLVLEKSIERSSSDRVLLYIKGGLLAKNEGRGRLEFRETLNRKFAIAAIHEYRPTLPWFLYKHTQAIVHLMVMSLFSHHLKSYDLEWKKRIKSYLAY